MKKVILFIATKKGYISFKKVMNSIYKENIACVFTFKETDVQKDWSNDIRQLSEKNNISCYYWNNDNKSKLKEIIVNNSVTSAIAISWKYLLPIEINDYLEDDLIVFHDSLLPKYRGFSPTPTAIMCGEKEIGITALFAVEEVDKGPIIEQRKQIINTKSYIKEIIDDQAEIYSELLLSIFEKIINNSITTYEQNEKEATYSIWRNIDDCHINWSDNASSIYNMIRAVGNPYIGAFTYIDGEKIIIEKSSIVENDLNFAIRTPGKIWSITDNCPIIICGKGLIKIERAYKENGEIYLFNKIRKRLV